MTIPCQFSQFPPNHWLMAVCLNRVCLRGLTVDAAMEKIVELGITPELKYQWNPIEEEIGDRCKPPSQNFTFPIEHRRSNS